MAREAVYLTGQALAALMREISDSPPLGSLRVSSEDGWVRFKIDEDMWSPPYFAAPDPKRTH